MSKNIFIATSEPYSGKSIIALGLVNMLLGKARNVGYFKPIINPDPKERKDDHIATVIEHFELAINYDDTYAFTRAQALQMIQNKSQGEMIDTIIDKF
jgi:phosphate acetyltransferase